MLHIVSYLSFSEENVFRIGISYILGKIINSGFAILNKFIAIRNSA